MAHGLGPRLVPAIRASKRESIGRRLDLAGRPGGLTVQRFVGYKASGAVLFGGPLLLLALAGGSPLLALLGIGFGWFAPDIWISRAGRLRQERIERELPDFLDILAVTVRAGLGYRLSLARVSESLGGPVGEEMLVALRQMELGASRRAAFEALRDRNASEQLSSFVAAQLQAEELGVPLSEALNDIAGDMRRAAFQAARRRAARAAPRVSLVVTHADRAGHDDPDLRRDAARVGAAGVRPPLSPREQAAVVQRGPDGAGGWLESACKLIVTIRSGLLLVTLLSLPREEPALTLTALALATAAVTSFIPLRYWRRVGPVLVRHPAYLATELVLATVILLLTGTESPFFYYTLATALLGGLLYGWPGAIMFSPLLVGVYYWVMSVHSGLDSSVSSFNADLGQPALYVVVAAAGAGARGLLDRQAEADARIAAQEREMAAQSERARLARDMHDSLAKTVSGIGFAALALASKIERDPHAAAEEARRLAADARQATREAREIITGLRTDDSDAALPLPVALKAEAERWAAAHGVALTVAIEDVGELDAVAARELEWILREALRNAERHARASSVSVRLRMLGGRAVLTIADDGAGFEVPDDLEDLSRGRHFGVTGMRERAQLAGGDLMVESAPGEGCVLSVWVPAPEARRDAPEPPRPPEPPPPPAPHAPAAEPSDTVPRAVPGYTWQ